MPRFVSIVYTVLNFNNSKFFKKIERHEHCQERENPNPCHINNIEKGLHI